MSGLTGHRIDRIESAQLRYDYPRTVGRNARLGSHGSGGSVSILRVRTDSGATGWGMSAGDPAGLARLRGRDLGEVFDPDVGVIDEAAAPLDFALHDLAGQLLDQSVHQMLGGAGDREVRCYDAAIYLDDLDPDDAPRGVEAVLANCQADCAAGFRDFKLKIGRGHRWMDAAAGLRRDIEITRAVREAYPGVRILVDANDGYDAEGILDYLGAVSDCELYWVEEPFPETAADLRQLRTGLGELGATSLIADGESHPDLAHLLELARDRLVDVLLMDIISYGLTPWRRLMPELRAIGVQASPHAWGQPLKTLYAAQLAAGLGNVPTVEGVPGTTVSAAARDYRWQDGVLRVPNAPGFGISLGETELHVLE